MVLKDVGTSANGWVKMVSTSCLFLFVYDGHSLVISPHEKKFILIEVVKQFIHIENNTSCPVEIRSLRWTNQASEAHWKRIKWLHPMFFSGCGALAPTIFLSDLCHCLQISFYFIFLNCSLKLTVRGNDQRKCQQLNMDKCLWTLQSPPSFGCKYRSSASLTNVCVCVT